MGSFPVWHPTEDRKLSPEGDLLKELAWLSSHMLQKAYRLPLTQKLPPLYSYKTPFFMAKVFHTSLPHPRIAFIVSKKTAPHAVTRNRVRRQLSAVIEELLPTLKGGYDILFIIQKGAVGAKSSEIREITRRFITQKQLQS